MPRAVYSLRIFANGGLAPGAGTVGPIVPAGFVYVVRDIDLTSSTVGAGDNLIVFNQVTGVLINVVHSMLDGGANYRWRGRQVYGAGEQVGFHAFVGTWSVAASGYQLSLP